MSPNTPLQSVVYVLVAYRHGNMALHHYVHSCYSSFAAAKDEAESHCDYRGGKYGVAVFCSPFDKPMVDRDDGSSPGVGVLVYYTGSQLGGDGLLGEMSVPVVVHDPAQLLASAE